MKCFGGIKETYKAIWGPECFDCRYQRQEGDTSRAVGAFSKWANCLSIIQDSPGWTSKGQLQRYGEILYLREIQDFGFCCKDGRHRRSTHQTAYECVYGLVQSKAKRSSAREPKTTQLTDQQNTGVRMEETRWRRKAEILRTGQATERASHDRTSGLQISTEEASKETELET